MPVLLSASCQPVAPDLAGLAGGGFVAAWTNDLHELRMRRLGSRGEAVAFEQRLFKDRDAHQGVGRVQASPEGGFAVVWTEPQGILLWPFENDGRLRRRTPISISASLPSRGLALASDGADGYVVLWFTGSTLHLARVDAEDRVTRHEVPGFAGAERLWILSAATDSNGILWMLRQDVPPNVSPRTSILTAFRVPLDDPSGFEAFFSRQDPEHSGAALAVDGRDRVILAWNDGISVFVQRFDSTGSVLGDPSEVVRDPERPRLRGLDLAADPEGNAALVWAKPFVPGRPETIYTRPFGAAGTFLGPVVEAVTDPFFFTAEHTVALTGPGEATVSWTRFVEGAPLIHPIPCNGNLMLFATQFPWAGPRTLLLGQGRFRIEVEWEDPLSGDSGSGRAIPDTEEGGGFWFFKPDNTELRVKVIDGREVNGHFWFFAGALSTVGYRITVTDQRTGLSKTYDNPPGRLNSVADTRAFAQP